MIRNLFIMLGLVAVVGFTPALAQGYFIKKNNTEAGEKRTLYNKLPPKGQGVVSGGASSKIKYKDKLKVKRQKITSLAKAGSLKEIHESGLTPTNIKEVMFYAEASRAVTQQAVYKRREALMVHLQKQRLNQEYRIAKQQMNAFKAQDAATESFEEPSASEKESAPKKKKSKKSKLFVKSKENKAKSTKVFTGYR